MSDIARQLLSEAREAALAEDYRRAMYLCEQALERDPHLPDIEAEMADILELYLVDGTVRAHDARDRGDVDEALRICDELLTRAPERANLLHTRALMHESQEDAMSDLQRILNLPAIDEEGLVVRAKTLELMGDIEAAEEAWTQAVSTSPGLACAWLGRAQIRLDLGDTEGALTDVREALRIEPDDGEAHATLASAVLYLGQFEEALRHVERAREAGFESSWIEMVEAGALFHLGRFARAKALFDKLANDDELDTFELVQYASAMVKLGSAAEAVAILETRVEPASRGSEWHGIMAEALLQLGDEPQGRGHLDTALKLDGEYDGEALPFATYNLAWCRAHRAALAEKFRLSGIDIEAERERAAEVLARAVSKDPSAIRYARASEEFASMWSRPDMQFPK